MQDFGSGFGDVGNHKRLGVLIGIEVAVGSHFCGCIVFVIDVDLKQDYKLEVRGGVGLMIGRLRRETTTVFFP